MNRRRQRGPGAATERPASYAEAAEVMGSCGAVGLRVRPRGGGTKLAWGRPGPEPDVWLETGGLDRVLEHNAGDLTAVVQAGVPLLAAQEVFAAAGQMLAVDPPAGGPGPDGAGGRAAEDSAAGGPGPDGADGAAGGATIGGVVATGDSGPLRHHYGAVRDLVLGVTVALSDGTLARAGGKVIKNVAGYDLGKLFTGSFGTLGLVVEVALRLHPRPSRTGTAVGRGGDPAALAAGASALAHAPLEPDALDVCWGGGSGAVLVRFGSADPRPRLHEAAALMGGAGLEVETVDDDEGLWERQRAGQRSGDGTVIRVSALPAATAGVLAAADAAGGEVVGRAGLGLWWIRLPGGGPAGAAAVEDLRRRLAPAPAVVLDASPEVRTALDPWGPETGPVELMRRVKARFDPAGVCAPGRFVGGI